MEDQIQELEMCHRCQCEGRECLETHTTCHGCNYSFDLDPFLNVADDRNWQVPLWAYDILRGNFTAYGAVYEESEEMEAV